jgi:hypothetical protein
MKICALVAGLLLIASCAHDVYLSLPIDIDGTWEGQLAGFMGSPPTTLIYNFKVDGDTLRGTVNGLPGQWIPLENGKIEGDRISFTVSADFPGGMKTTWKYRGKVESDKIDLTYKTKTSGGFGGMGAPPQRLSVRRAK